MNDTLKRLSNLLDLYDHGVISELDLLIQMHDLWRDLSNTKPETFEGDHAATFRLVDFTYIHFKETVDARLKEANK